jgi:hypothetical protein
MKESIKVLHWWGHHHAGYTWDLVFYKLQVITNLVFISEIWYCSPSVPAHQLHPSTSSLVPLRRLLTTTSSTRTTTQCLNQLLSEARSTTSTTHTTTFNYFNNLYDYFRLLQQLIQLLPSTSITRMTSSCVTTTRCYVTYFGPSRPCIVLGLKPRLRTPPPGHPQP